MAGNGNGSGYGPQVQIARLYECKSQSTGNTYFRGRLGGASITLLKSRDVAPDSGAPIWNLLVQEAPAKAASEGEPQRDPNRTNTQRAREARPGDVDRAQRAQNQPMQGKQRSDLDDQMPF
jgi:hypothetical protein